jgi:arsenate reductase
MAEGLLRELGGGDYEVHSAGLEPRDIQPMAIAVMGEVGIDISRHTVSHLDDYLGIQFDFAITLCDQVKNSCIAFPRDCHTIHWHCDDPSIISGTEEQKLAAFRQARDTIAGMIRLWIAANRK